MAKYSLRWGILGTAGIAESHIRGVRASGTGTITAVAGRSRERVEAFAARHGVAQVFVGYENLLGAGVVDAIYIPLPNSLHAEWTTRALETGHHVLCEKPFATSLSQAQAMIDAAKRHQRRVAEGFMYRFHPQWETIVSLVRGGAIGDLRFLDSAFSFLLDDPGENPGSAELGGGALLDVGCYCVDFSRWIAGAPVRRVSAFEKRRGVDWSMAGMMEFDNGVLARFETSLESSETHVARITGTTGSIVIDSPWIPAGPQARLRLERHEQETRVFNVPGGDSFALQAAAFADVCCGDSAPTRCYEDILENAAVIEALFQSARLGAAVVFEPVREDG